MALKITEIKNLTTSAIVAEADLTNFSFEGTSTDTITIKGDIPEWNSTDNIQVTWTDGVKAGGRAVSGMLDKENKKITGLLDVSKYSVSINGQLGIGPEANPEAVLVSVRIGNIPSERNPKADLIIDFSDKQDGAPGTSIKLNDLVGWIQGKSGDKTAVSFPPAQSDGKDIKNYEIEFKEFYYNITQNTFDFNVQSKDGDEMKFGNFTIKKAGFRVTNTPVKMTTKAIEK